MSARNEAVSLLRHYLELASNGRLADASDAHAEIAAIVDNIIKAARPPAPAAPVMPGPPDNTRRLTDRQKGLILDSLRKAIKEYRTWAAAAVDAGSLTQHAQDCKALANEITTLTWELETAAYLVVQS